MAKNLRPGKVLHRLESEQNAAKTTVAPYSLRAQSVPAVSTPLTWGEVEAGAATGSRPSARPYTAGEVLKRVEKQGDLLADLLHAGPDLPD